MARDWASEVIGGDESSGIVQAQSAQPQARSRDWADEIIRGGQESAPAPKSQPSPDGGGNVFVRLGNAVTGKQDPRYKHLPAYDTLPESGQSTGRGLVAMLGGADDAAYGDVLQQSLGGKVRRRFKDANGYDILEFVDDSGATKQAYVNKPGLDPSDGLRGVTQGLSYLGTGRLAQLLTKGGGMALRGGAQSVAAGLTSVAGDAASMAAGSKQGIDPVKAGVAMAFSGAAEVLPSKVMAPVVGGAIGAALQLDPRNPSTAGELAQGTGLGAAAGYAAAALFRRMAMNPGAWIKSNGELTPAGDKLVRAQGLDPAEMTALAKQEFAKTYAMSRDATRSATASDLADFGIPSTVGQRTKDPQLLMREKAYRSGVYGDEPKAEMIGLDQAQNLAVREAVFGRNRPASLPGSARPPAGYNPQQQQGIAQQINPQGWANRDLAERGDTIRQGVSAVKQAGKEAENEAWTKVGPIKFSDEGIEQMPDMLKNRIATTMPDGVIIDQNTPTAMRMIQAIDEMYRAGRKSPPPAPDPYLPQTQNALALSGAPVGRTNALNAETKYLPDARDFTVDQVRKRLGAMTTDAATDMDRKAAKTVYRAYNGMLDDAASAQALSGNVQGLKDARAVSNEWKSAFGPRRPDGRATPAASRLESIMNGDNAPERVVREIIGDVTVRSTPGSGSLETVRALKTILTKQARNRNDAALSAQSEQTWNEIRNAYWQRIAEAKTGDMNGYQALLNNLKAAQTNQGSIMRELFTVAERSQMKRLERALETIVYKDPNPSGTATGAAVLARDLFQTIGNSLGISKLAATGVGTLLRPFSQQWHKAGARAATSQDVPFNPPSLGGFGAVTGVTYEKSRRTP